MGAVRITNAQWAALQKKTGLRLSSTRPKRTELELVIATAEKDQLNAEFWLLLRAAGISAGWRKEFVFAHPRKYPFDFALPAQLLAVEVEGGIWRQGGGAHSHPLNIERDIEKYNLATLNGWRVLRVTGKMIRDGSALDLIQRAIEARRS